MSEEKPLLALVMIVKNEARSIKETIASVKGFVDRWLVLDTGSTDGTQDLVREAFGELPGRVVEEDFVDFGTTRNRALELLGTEATFSLMLSGDETVVGGEALRAFCKENETRGGNAHGAYYLRVEFGTSVYDSARLARTDAGWRYAGVTHEVLTKEKAPPPTIRVPNAHVVHDVSHRAAGSQTKRWELDLRLLTEEAKKKPNDARTAFYLAQTLECLGEYKRAFGSYERRIKMGGWQEEVFESMYRLGRTMSLGQRPWPEVQQRYLDAYAHSPHRAEPLYAIAMHYYEKKSWGLTYLFAKRGSELPFPEKASLFVDRDVYRYKLLDLVGTAAYYVQEFDAGEAALDKAIAALGEGETALRERFTKNRAFYEDRKKKSAPPAVSSLRRPNARAVRTRRRHRLRRCSGGAGRRLRRPSRRGRPSRAGRTGGGTDRRRRRFGCRGRC